MEWNNKSNEIFPNKEKHTENQVKGIFSKFQRSVNLFWKRFGKLETLFQVSKSNNFIACDKKRKIIKFRSVCFGN